MYTLAASSPAHNQSSDASTNQSQGTRTNAEKERTMDGLALTGFGKLVAVAGLIEQIGGVFVFAAEQAPAVELLLGLLLEV